MTDAEKARRKAARSARGKAHRARRNEFNAAMELASAPIDALFHSIYDPLNDYFNDLFRSRDIAIDVVKAEMKTLEQRMEKVRADFQSMLTAAREPMSAAVDKRNVDKSAAEADVYAKFPDMKGSGRFSAAVWRPIEEFLP